MPNAKDILGQHNLRATSNRLLVLKAFFSKAHALSYHEVERAIPSKIDRVTLYRTLNSFIENGIIHKVTDNDGGTHFALCSSCDDHHHHDEHIHFKCISCDELVCIEDARLTTPALPTGYKSKSIKVVVEGTCPNCN